VTPVGYVTSGCFCIFGELYLALGTNPMSQFLGSKCFGIQAIIRVFRALIGFLSYLQQKFWLKNSVFRKNQEVSQKAK